MRVGGGQGRLNVGETRSAVASASSQEVPAAQQGLYVDQWPRLKKPLQKALAARASEVLDQRSRAMDAKRDTEEKRLRGTLQDLRASILRRLDELQESETVEQLRLFDDDGHRQIQADIQALRDRAERIGDDIEKEAEILQRRYEVRDVNWFPVAVEFLIPKGQV